MLLLALPSPLGAGSLLSRGALTRWDFCLPENAQSQWDGVLGRLRRGRKRRRMRYAQGVTGANAGVGVTGTPGLGVVGSSIPGYWAAIVPGIPVPPPPEEAQRRRVPKNPAA